MEAIVVPWRVALADYVRREALPREKYGHQVRLYALTQQIGKGLTYDDDIVYAAAWLHDMGVFVGHRPEQVQKLEAWDSVAYAMQITPGLLVKWGFPAEKIPAVLECIRTHQPQCETETVEATILRDADILEQLGAIGIIRTVCKIGRDTRFTTFTEALVGLREVLETLPGALRLPASKSLSQQRIQLHSEFLSAVSFEAGDSLL